MKIWEFQKAFLNYNKKEIKFVSIEIPIGRYNAENKAELARAEDYLIGKYGPEFMIKKTSLYDYEYYALLSIADCGLILNSHAAVSLQALDFLLVQHENFAPLIVSENCGFSKNLMVKKVNPKDSNEVARKIKKVLNFSDEKRKQFYNIKHDDCAGNRWQKTFMENIGKLDSCNLQYKDVDLCSEFFFDTMKNKSRHCTLLDYDGTLSAIVSNPEDACPNEKLLKILGTLAKNMHVIIVTGRDKKTIDKWINIPGIEIFAEHGTYHKQQGEWVKSGGDQDWKRAAIQIINFYIERSPGATIEIKDSGVAFHYRNCNPIIQEKQANACYKSLFELFYDFKEIRILKGKCVIEVRSGGKDKGSVVNQIKNIYDWILCAGDDVTDEDMFKAAQPDENIHSILVGNRKTHAKSRIDSVDEFLKFLEKLIDYKETFVRRNHMIG